MFKNLIKNVYRYLLKSKASFIGLCLLLFVSIFSFSMLTNLSKTLTRSYTNLVNKQKLHDITVNESYIEDQKSVKQAQFNKLLGELKLFYALQGLNFDWTRSNSLIVNSTKDDITYKIVEYSTNKQINTFDEQTIKRLVANSFFDVDLYSILNNAKADVIDLIKTKNFNTNLIVNNLKELEDNPKINLVKLNKVDNYDVSNSQQARLYLLKNIVYGAWPSKTNSLYTSFKKAYEYSLEDKNYDPLVGNVKLNNKTNFDALEAKKISTQFILMLYPSKKGISLNGNVNTVVKGHRITFSFEPAGIPIPVYFDVKSAYTLVGLDAFLSSHNKQKYPMDLWQKALVEHQDQKSFEKWFNSLDEKYIVHIDNTPYLILDSGITPDFMYPIISFTSVIPNPKKEGLVYANLNGYARIHDAFRSNPAEKNLQIRITNQKHEAVDINTLKKITKDLNDRIKKESIMNWPTSLDAAYLKDDTNNHITPSPLRLVFIDKITSTIQTFSILITLFILVLAVFVVVIIINRFLAQNKINIGISIANGVARWKIILSFGFIGLIPCVVGGLCGYLVAYFTQNLAVSIFSGYWLIPTALEGFDFGALITVIVFPFLLFFALIAILGYWSVRKPPINLMRGTETFKISKIVHVIKLPFKYMSGFNKYLITLSFSSITRIIIFSIMIALSFGSIMFLTGTRGKIKQTTDATLQTKKYRYGIDLITPTDQGGQYISLSTNQIGSTLSDENNHELTQKYESSDYKDFINSPLFKNLQNLKLIGAKDDQRRTYDINYIANAFQVKQFLDFNFGFGDINSGSSSNPWSITKSLIPENNLQILNETYKKWGSKLINDHSIFSKQLIKKGVNELAYDNLNIRNSYDPNEYFNPFEFKDIINTHLKQFDKSLLDQHVSYEILVRVHNNLFNYKNIYGKLVFRKNEWIIYFENSNFSIGDQNFISGIYYKKSNEQDYDLDHHIFKNVDLIYDEIYFERNRKQNYQKLIYQTFSSYFRTRFLKYDPEGNFNYLLPLKYLNATIVRKELLQNAINNEIIFKNEQNKITKKISFKNDNDLVITKINDATYEIKNVVNNQIYIYYPRQIKRSYKIDPAKATNAIKTGLSVKLDNDFINLVLLTHPSINPSYTDVWSGITFNMIGFDYLTKNNKTQLNEFDEPYIWIDAQINKINKQKYEEAKNPKIIGIIKNSKLVHLLSNKKQINHLLFNENDEQVAIINRVAAKYYNLKIGDHFSFVANNQTNRYTKDYVKKQITLKVVGIIDTYQEIEIYTGIKNAAQILGMHSSPYADKSLYEGYDGAFNGIFTNKSDPAMLTRIISIYSPSGLYPVSEIWKKDAATIDLIKNILSDKYSMYELNNKSDPKSLVLSSRLSLTKALGYKDFNTLKLDARNIYDENHNYLGLRNEQAQAEWVIDKLISIYGRDTYSSTLKNVEVVDVLFAVLETASKTIQTVEIVVILLILFIIILVLVLMSINSLSDILKVAKLLKNMGYNDLKNAQLFLMAFLPPLIIGSIISIPLVVLVMQAFSEMIFNSLNVLLTTGFIWWHFLIILLIVAIILLIMWAIAIRILRTSNIADASKRG
ncbi:FtsX-like permease family protein [Ureaplasma urealyticum]|uniref:FtsX-like permease family protein n=1 Tax=Ureaplasma urealyticum TaxID=2130 RepID=UPI00017E13DD|nr:efflux ABC transporter, permease protein [Ureaplasma urealyticum serovar 12 str. ATCC 33696]